MQSQHNGDVEPVQPPENVSPINPSKISSFQNKQSLADFDTRIPDRYLVQLERDKERVAHSSNYQPICIDRVGNSRITSLQEGRHTEPRHRDYLSACNSSKQKPLQHEKNSKHWKQSSTCVQEQYSCLMKQSSETCSTHTHSQKTFISEKFNKASQCELSSVLPLETNDQRN